MRKNIRAILDRIQALYQLGEIDVKTRNSLVLALKESITSDAAVLEKKLKLLSWTNGELVHEIMELMKGEKHDN